EGAAPRFVAARTGGTRPPYRLSSPAGLDSSASTTADPLALSASCLPARVWRILSHCVEPRRRDGQGVRPGDRDRAVSLAWSTERVCGVRPLAELHQGVGTTSQSRGPGGIGSWITAHHNRF